MDDIINKKIQELAHEATALSNMKGSLIKQLKEIDTRLTQISGALVELQKIKHELKGDNHGVEASSDSKPEVSRSTGEVEQKQDPSEDSIQAQGDNQSNPN